MKRLHPDFRYLTENIESSVDHYFITGRAGTGKSTFIRTFLKLTSKKTVLLAPTGVAALNIGGMTVHSFFGFPPTLIREADWKKPFRVNILRALELIVIDEVSMLRADILDAIDMKLRFIRKAPDTPFGGVQMLFVGDLFQLPPVLPRQELDILRQFEYSSPYFFSARVFDQLALKTFELTEVFRQTDRSFIDLLDRFRRNQLEYDDFEQINARCVPFDESDHRYITLCARNRTVDEINRRAMDRLFGEMRLFTAVQQGSIRSRSFPVEEQLYLRKNARVMMLKNDPDKLYVNGSLATVCDIESDAVYVMLDDDPEQEPRKIEPHQWEVISYRMSGNKKDFETEVLGTFTQLPLKPAWALTIHKSQGKTFDRVLLNMEGGSFEHGQTYVALSRCTSLEGLILQHKLQPRDVRVDPDIVSFYEQWF